jgi:hypothetical protein
MPHKFGEVAGMVPGVNREPMRKIAPDPELLLRLLYRWRAEAIKTGKEISRIAVAYGARWLLAGPTGYGITALKPM